MASVAATLLTQPADIIRTHMQLGLGRGASRMGPLQTLQAIWQLGPSAVFAGATPRVCTLQNSGKADVHAGICDN